MRFSFWTVVLASIFFFLGGTLQAQAAIPAGTQSWESIPGVIRNDGIESFRLEINAHRSVSAVTLEQVSSSLIAPQPAPIQLRDDGIAPDRIAGDNIYTAGQFTFKPGSPMAANWRYDPASPAGVDATDIGMLTITETDAATTKFIEPPQIGILRKDIPNIPVTQVSPDVAVSPHLINVQTANQEAQRSLRFLPSSLHNITKPIYQHLADTFDFLMVFSTSKVERVSDPSFTNTTKGIHETAQVNYTGTGQNIFDGSSSYGSSGKLLGINILDTYRRGIHSSNATHELLHQWSSHVDPSTGLNDPVFRFHYPNQSNVGSLIGGFLWTQNPDGSFTINCAEGRNGATHASLLDKYFMGLLDASQMPEFHIYDAASTPPLTRCRNDEDILPSEIAQTTTIQDIQAIHGVRTPGPSNAQRDFHLGFVAESNGRMLTPTEMTFYEIFADYYTKPVALGSPDPYQGENWVPITRFFQEGTTWSSAIPIPTPPPPPPQHLITGISTSDGKEYEADILELEKLVYTDREYTFTKIPKKFLDAEFIRTANNDKYVTGQDYLSFTLTAPATVYIAYDVRGTPEKGGTLPAWLQTWQNTKEFLNTNDVSHRIYKKEFPAGPVVLGGNRASPAQGANSNYSVFAVPTPEELKDLIEELNTSTGKEYQKDTLQESSLVYTDRDYTFSNVPTVFVDAEFIRTANNDKYVTGQDYLSFTLTAPATILVAYDVRGTAQKGGTTPDWLADWQDSGKLMYTNDVVRSLYIKEFPAGPVVLGGNRASPAQGANSNYNVIVVKTK